MSDHEQLFIAPGFDANLHACQTCLDLGISQETAGYCAACRMGKRIEQLDQFAEQLKGHGFTEAMRIVYRTTQRTEKAIAAADKALMMAERQAQVTKIAELEAKLAAREGWCLVPDVSTSKMDRAGEHAYESNGFCDCGNANGVSMEEVYNAMIAVAPLPDPSPVSKQG